MSACISLNILTLTSKNHYINKNRITVISKKPYVNSVSDKFKYIDTYTGGQNF